MCVDISAQELARHEEKILLLEGGQQQAQEQLAERAAEVVRAERTQRKLHAELKRLQERLKSTEEELQHHRYTKTSKTLILIFFCRFYHHFFHSTGSTGRHFTQRDANQCIVVLG